MIPIVRNRAEGFAAVTLSDDFNANANNVVMKGAYSLLSAMKNVEEE